jgi:hypothetical protein
MKVNLKVARLWDYRDRGEDKLAMVVILYSVLTDMLRSLAQKCIAHCQLGGSANRADGRRAHARGERLLAANGVWRHHVLSSLGVLHGDLVGCRRSLR